MTPLKFTSVFLALLLGLLVARSAAAGAVVVAPSAATIFSRVQDKSGVLTPKELQRLKELTMSGETITGDRFVIIVEPELEEKQWFHYIDGLSNQWLTGRGKPGVVLLVAVKERQAWLKPDGSLDALLPSHLQQQIIERIIIPNLREGNINKALEDGTRAVAVALQGGYAPAPTGIEAQGETPTQSTAALEALTGLSIPNWAPLLAAAVFLFGLMNSGGWNRGYGHRYGGGRGRW